MSTPFEDLQVIDANAVSSTYDRSSDIAYTLTRCPSCGGEQMAVVGFQSGGHTCWMRCLNCHFGMVRNGQRVSPPVLPLTAPQGVKGRELEVWEEARQCLSVGAFTAAVMLCRKLLLHVAVSHGLPPSDDTGRSPNFDLAVKHLLSEGVITNRMHPWVDRIREIGNGANHELGAITSTQAEDVGKFTEQLLRLAYEMDVLVAGGFGRDEGDAPLDGVVESGLGGRI